MELFVPQLVLQAKNCNSACHFKQKIIILMLAILQKFDTFYSRVSSGQPR